MVERTISAVIFDVVFDAGESEWSEDEALLQIFAFTPALKMRSVSSVRYQSGDYTETGDVWTGKLAMLHATQASNVVFDENRGNIFEASDDEVVTTGITSIYAYDPVSHTLSFWSRGGMDYTKIRTYVRVALRDWEDGPYIDLRVRKSSRTLREWLSHFDTIESISFRFTHSQSPGDDFVDNIFDEIDVDEIRQTLQSNKPSGLNKRALASGETQPAKVVEHLNVNPNNGTARITGYIGDERLHIDIRNAIERHRITTGVDSTSIATALASIIRSLR